jgi:outer membrane protein assembly factor BamB
LGGYGTRNNIISTPVFIENSVVVGVGEDPDHGEGVGHFWRIDATKTGDVSRDLGGEGEPIRPNPNSGVIWHFGGVDEDGSVTGEPGEDAFHRTLSTAAIGDGKVWIADLSGYFYCIDFETGKPYWRYDLKSAIWGSPMLVDGRVLLGSEDGRLYVFEANSDAPVVQARFDTKGASAIYSTPTIANGFLYLTDRTRLYAIKVQ